jgi:hypothetical protein
LPGEAPPAPEKPAESEAREDASSVVDTLENSEPSLPGDDDLLLNDGKDEDSMSKDNMEDDDAFSVKSEDDDDEEEDEEDEDQEEDEDIEAKIKQHEQRIKNRRRGRRGESSGFFGWLVLLVLLGGGAWGGFQYRDDIVAYYPPAADFYQSIGLLQPLGEGLKILPARTETLENDGEKTLLVVGEIYNTRTDAKGVLDIPLLRGALIDANEREVRVWTFRAEEERILPNERIVYRTEIGDPPSNVRALVITFARPREELR